MIETEYGLEGKIAFDIRLCSTQEMSASRICILTLQDPNNSQVTGPMFPATVDIGHEQQISATSIDSHKYLWCIERKLDSTKRRRGMQLSYKLRG